MASGRGVAIFDAIQANNAPVLETLLSAGANRSMRREAEEGQPARRSRSSKVVLDYELYPLFFATVTNTNSVQSAVRYGQQSKLHMKDRHVPVIKMLPQKGADPFAKFKTLLELSGNKGDEIDVTLSEESTLLHEVLEYGGIIEPLLECSDLDLEHRDAKGRALLLAACSSSLDPDHSIDDVYIRDNSIRADEKVKRASGKPTSVELLLQRGACDTARDNSQRNALHSLLAAYTESLGGHDTLQVLISHVPELVHQFDAQDNTTLHLLARWLAERGRIPGDNNPDKPRDLFKRLVSLGLPINGRNAKCETPAFAFMHQQSQYRSRSYEEDEDTRQLAGLQILADAGADFLAVNAAGENLLHILAATDEDSEDPKEDKVMLDRFQWLLLIRTGPGSHGGG